MHGGLEKVIWVGGRRKVNRAGGQGRGNTLFLANFIFVVSHLKIHPAIPLNTSIGLTSLLSERKVY